MIIWDELEERLSENKDMILENGEIYDLSETAAARYIQYLQLENANLKKDLVAQEELNRNLIRVSIERKNKENNRKAKSSGYFFERVTELNNYSVTKRVDLVHCYKIRIQTPYDPAQFLLRAVKRQIRRDWEAVEEILGKIVYVKGNELNMVFLPGFKAEVYAPNYIWDVSFEADYVRKMLYMVFMSLHELPTTKEED